MSPRPELAWIGPAVQQSILSDLSVALAGGAAQADSPAIDSNDAVKTASQANARYVVFGSFQSIDGLLRFTAQVWDAKENKSIAGLKVTGEAHDIFSLEDELAMQIKRAVSRSQNDVRSNPSEQTGPPSAADLAIEPSRPLRLNSATEAPDASITYAQPYAYSSHGAQAGAWRYVYAGSPTWSLYYGCGYGYCSYYGFCFPASFCSVHYGTNGRAFGSSTSIGSGGGPGAPTPAPIFGSSLYSVPVGGNPAFTSGGGASGASHASSAHPHGGHR